MIENINRRLRGMARPMPRRWWEGWIHNLGSIRTQNFDIPLLRRIRPKKPAPPRGKVPIFSKMASSSYFPSNLRPDHARSASLLLPLLELPGQFGISARGGAVIFRLDTKGSLPMPLESNTPLPIPVVLSLGTIPL